MRHLGSVRSDGLSDGEPFLSELWSHDLELCGDLTLDGAVGNADIDLLREALAGAETLELGALERCPTTARSGPAPESCDILDLIVLSREIDGGLLGPGTSRDCSNP